MAQQYTMGDVKAQIKPLSNNGFIAFFQNIWRWWLGVWYGFADKQPKLAKLAYTLFFFIVFSQGVTIFQGIIFATLPHAFGLELASKEWLWPGITIFTDANGIEYKFALLGKAILYEDGIPVIGGGIGYTIAFWIGTFLAQCINFPLQRNITYKSKGNPWYQAMWYFIGWLLIQPFCDGLISIYKALIPMFNITLPGIIALLLDIFIMGGVSMAIFFFVFMVIFPDLDKMAANAAKKVEKLKASGADAEKIAEAEAKAAELKAKAELETARKNKISTATLASAKAISWEASAKLLETMKANPAKYTAEQIAAQEAVVKEKYQEALEATANKYAARDAYTALKMYNR